MAKLVEVNGHRVDADPVAAIFVQQKEYINRHHLAGIHEQRDQNAPLRA